MDWTCKSEKLPFHLAWPGFFTESVAVAHDPGKCLINIHIILTKSRNLHPNNMFYSVKMQF